MKKNRHSTSLSERPLSAKRGFGAVLLALSVVFFISGCAAVKPYQKMYLNDPDMELKARDIEAYEISCESYREGSTGGHGGKSGGGCGCF